MVDGQGLLPEPAVAPIGTWLAELAGGRRRPGRRGPAHRSTARWPRSTRPSPALADAADDQAARRRVADRPGRRGVPRRAAAGVEHGLRDGTLLRGEVLARWQEFVGTGELVRTLEARIGRTRDRVVAAVAGRPVPASRAAARAGVRLVDVVRAAAADAAEQAYAGWQAAPGRRRPAARPTWPARPATWRERAERLVRDWQRAVLELVRAEAADKRVRGPAAARTR